MKSKHVLTVLIATAVSAMMPAHAERILAKNSLFTASVADSTSWCQDNVAVAIATPDAANFSGERIDLQRFMGQVRMALDDECPQAKSLSINGVVNGQGSRFKGLTSSANGWILKEVIATPVATAAAAPVTPQVASAPINKTQLCDQLASHEDDPEAFANGVADDALDAYKVIEACSLAVKQDKNSPRLSFQLARGYLKANKMEEAIEQLLLAAQSGHGGAFAYLGDIYLDGGPGIEPDPAIAHNLYTRAAGFGFEPAKTILSQFEDYTEKTAQADKEEFDAENESKFGYANPDIIKNIASGNLDAVPNNEIWVKYYLIEVADNIRDTCKKHFTTSDIDGLRTVTAFSAVDASPSGGMAALHGAAENFIDLYMTAARGGAAGVVAREQERENRNNQITTQQIEEGVRDSIIFMQVGAPCGSKALSSFSDNLRKYIQDHDAPRMTTEQLYNSCQITSNKNRTSQGNKFCFCVSRKLYVASMSRAERKTMNYEFQHNSHARGANVIMQKQSNRSEFEECFR